jgi:hypothetical protein
MQGDSQLVGSSVEKRATILLGSPTPRFSYISKLEAEQGWRLHHQDLQPDEEPYH